MSLRNLVGRGFGGTISTPGPTPPTATITVADQLDGTGATATITGTDVGSDNDVAIYSTSRNGALTLVDTFTRSGNGTVDLVLDPGQYLAVLVSNDFACAPPVLFLVTLGAASPFTNARGPITLAEHAAAITLRDCTEFRTWCGATTEAQAAARIYFDWPPAPPGTADAHVAGILSAYRPFAIVWTDEARGYHGRRIASEAWTDGGNILIQLIQDSAPGAEAAEIFRRFKNSLGQIISHELAPNVGLFQLANLSPDADHMYLALDRVELQGPVRAGEDEAEGLGDFLAAQLTLSWGGG